MSPTEYRLSWEMPTPHECDGYEQLNGKTVWQRFSWEQLHLTWHRHEITFTDDARMGQYHNLRDWAMTKEQPIRNVKLEQRTIPDSEHGWRLAKPDQEPTP